VQVDDKTVGAIKTGLLVLLGVMKGDNKGDADYMVDKIANIRIFEDDAGKMNLSLLDVGGELLLVSQFTLAGDARRGRRPSFSDAENPETARRIIEEMVHKFEELGIKVATGSFGAHMMVSLVNDGPVTIMLDSSRAFYPGYRRRCYVPKRDRGGAGSGQLLLGRVRGNKESRCYRPGGLSDSHSQYDPPERLCG